MPFKLADAIVWLGEKLDEVPPEFRQAATMLVDTYSEWGEAYPHIEISYQRPETEEERANRQKDDAQDDKERETIELAQLAHLQAKYGVRG